MKTIKSRGKGLKLSEVDRLMKGPQQNDVDDDDDDEYEPGDSSESEGDDYPSRVPGDEDEDEEEEEEDEEEEQFTADPEKAWPKRAYHPENYFGYTFDSGDHRLCESSVPRGTTRLTRITVRYQFGLDANPKDVPAYGMAMVGSGPYF